MRPTGNGSGSFTVDTTPSNSGTTTYLIPSGASNRPARSVDAAETSSRAEVMRSAASLDGDIQRSRASSAPSSMMAQDTPSRYSVDGTGNSRESPTKSTL